MKPPKTSLFFHPLFVASLLLLFINDFYWKQAYPNWVTGKLSDAAGLIVLPVFLHELFPNGRKVLLVLISVLFFAWWKSPLAQPLIYFFNHHLSIPLQRTVDYTDLFILPAVILFFLIKPVSLSLNSAAPLLRFGVGGFTFLALCATSMPYREIYVGHMPGEIITHEEITVKKSENEILQSLAERKVTVRRDSVTYHPLSTRHSFYFRNSGKNDSSVVWQQIPADSTIYLKKGGRAFYMIPEFEAGDIRLRNIRFEISSNKKGTKSTVHVEGFQSNLYMSYYMDKKTQEAHKKLLQELFKGVQ